MIDLLEEYEAAHRLDLFELGMVINAAMGENPRRQLNDILNPPRVLDLDELPGMLRPVRRTNGGSE